DATSAHRAGVDAINARVDAVVEASPEVWEAAAATEWPPSAATDALGALDVLAEALGKAARMSRRPWSRWRAATAAARALLRADAPPRAAVGSPRRLRPCRSLTAAACLAQPGRPLLPAVLARRGLTGRASGGCRSHSRAARSW
ncbi:hypothetical protein, partial [Streptomyces sp. NPDC057557]|uniref:hypothetical protein n=1 Tax=Streptomyces sp. NPDC057557 TaxID=3346167 RepID=UPI00369223C5